MWVGSLIALTGCIRIPTGGDDFTIATTWSEAERGELEAAFGRWLARAEGGPQASKPGRIDWVSLAPGEDLSRAVQAPSGAIDLREKKLDVVLGGPASSYARLAREEKLLPIDRQGNPPWCVSRRSPIGLATNPNAKGSGGGSPGGDAPGASPRERTTFDDPRHDPLALAWAKGQLRSGGWAEGYAGLVRDAGHPRRIGRQARSALAAVGRGEAGATPAIAPGISGLRENLMFLAVADAPEWVEGVAIVRGGSNPALAQAFLRFLAERGQAEPPPAIAPEESVADEILADLLGATLVDAQDELWEAWATLGRTGHPPDAERWMTQPPPWPPASITRLVDEDPSGALLQTLADELAPGVDVRAWLLRSWLAPTRPVDGGLLEELSKAVDGRVAREPRFRAWLRAEWTAWARQRYRRVARKAEGWTP